LLVAAAPGAANGPRQDYQLQCQGCHLADGSGSEGADVSPLAGVPDLRGRIGRFASLPQGRAYLVGVPGSAQSPLDDAELAAVLNWMVREFDPVVAERGFPPFDEHEVERLRRPLADVASVRARLLRALAGRAGRDAAAAASARTRPALAAPSAPDAP